MKTALIFTGGTIGSTINSDGYIAPSSGGKYDILSGYDETDFDILNPYTILSENLDFEHITALLKCIEQNLDNHDGIIVMHGTDTLQYAAAAAAYAFGLDTVPIIFVSSNYILSDSRANGRINFSCAVDFIKNGCGRGTFISYKNAGEAAKIHRAARALPYTPYSDAVTSLGGEYGRYENDNFVKNTDYTEFPDVIQPFGVMDLTKSRVIKLSAYLEMDIGSHASGAAGASDAAGASGADAILLETYHSGTVCESVVENTDKKIFILGVEDRTQYASVKAYDRENVTVLKKAAAPAMYIKLNMALSAGRLDDMNKPLGGDFAE